MRTPTAWWSGRAQSLATHTVPLTGTVLHRDTDRVDRVKLRYRSEPVPCRLAGSGDRVEITLDEPAAGVAPGQTACLMDGDRVVGHGTIAA